MNRNNSRYGLDLGKLRSWSKERSSQYLSEETSKQEIAVAKVRAFLDAIRKDIPKIFICSTGSKCYQYQ